MASVLVRSVCAGVLAATASTGAWGCAPSGEPDEAAVEPTRLPPPQPALISFVTPALGVPSPGPTPPAVTTVTTPPVEPLPVQQPHEVGPDDTPRVAAPTDILSLSQHIDGVMTDLDRLVAESLRLQHALLRLRLRPKQAAPPEPAAEPDPGELPVGL